MKQVTNRSGTTKNRDSWVSARVPGKLRDLLQAQVRRDTHLNESEFIREAIREKLQREASDLYQTVVQLPAETTSSKEASVR